VAGATLATFQHLHSYLWPSRGSVPMATPEEYERIKALLKSGFDPSDEEWAWINRYLTIAERAYRDEKPTEPAAQAKPLAEPETEKAG